MDVNSSFRETTLWKEHVLLKYRHKSTKPHGVTSQKTVIFSLRIEKLDFQAETSFWIWQFLPGVSCFRLLAQKASFLFLPDPVSEITGLIDSYNIKLEQVFSVSHETVTLRIVTFNDVVN
jgi:hypothetical protein